MKSADAKTFVPHFKCMAKFQAVKFFRKQLQECGDVFGIIFLGGSELPQDGTEFRFQFSDTAGQEFFNRGASLGQNAAVNGKARRLQRKYEIVGCLLRPAPEYRGRKGAVERAVDLD